MKYTLILLLICGIYSFDHYKIKLKAMEKRCFTDDVFKETLVRLELRSTTPYVNIELTKPADQRINYVNTQFFEQAFTTKEAGVIEFCVVNTFNDSIETEVDYATGLEAKDFGGLIKENDLQPVNMEIENIEHKIKNFKLTYYHAEMSEKTYKDLKEELGDYITKWFIIITAVFIAVASIETLIIKKQLNAYKLK